MKNVPIPESGHIQKFPPPHPQILCARDIFLIEIKTAPKCLKRQTSTVRNCS